MVLDMDGKTQGALQPTPQPRKSTDFGVLGVWWLRMFEGQRAEVVDGFGYGWRFTRFMLNATTFLSIVQPPEPLSGASSSPEAPRG